MTLGSSRPVTDGTIEHGVDAGVFRLVDAILELDGWSLGLGHRGDLAEVALVHRDEPCSVIPHFASGATPGQAALAAIRRFHRTPVADLGTPGWPLAC